MKKVVCIAILLFSVSAIQLSAQSGDDKARSGSVYSQIGVGIPMDFSSSSAQGLGLPGVSFFESNVPGLANPAEWGSTFYTLATGGFSMQKLNVRDNRNSAENAVFAANNFQLQFPIAREKLGVSVSFAPLTRSNFRIFETQSRIIGSGSRTDTVTANIESRGNGGVNSLEMGMGWRINSTISVGYAASLNFASIDNNITSIFESTTFQGVNFIRQTSGYGFGHRFGALITIPSLLSGNDQLRLGTAVRLPVVLDSERIQTAEKQLGNNRVESVTLETGSGLGDGEIRMPLKLSGGLTYRPVRTLYLSAEGLYQQWSEFGFSFNQRQQNMMDDRYKGGFGIRYFPFASGTNTFLSRFKYRAGVSYDTGHLKISGQKIDKWLFTAGIGIPSPKSRSSVDLNVYYGIRGTQAQDLVKESIWGLQLSINLAELMFVRPKLQ